MVVPRDFGLLAALLLIAALLGCSARHDEGSDAFNQPTARSTKARNVYSPNIANDPYVLDEQRRIAQALRRSCESSGEHCTEAEAAEKYMALADARR